jgi:hypothetical protein
MIVALTYSWNANPSAARGKRRLRLRHGRHVIHVHIIASAARQRIGATGAFDAVP